MCAAVSNVLFSKQSKPCQEINEFLASTDKQRTTLMAPDERGFTLNHIKCPSFPFNVELHRRSNNYKVSKQRVFHIPLHNRMQSGQKKTKKNNNHQTFIL